MPLKTSPAAKPVGKLHRKNVRPATVSSAAAAEFAVPAVRPRVRIRAATPEDRDALARLRRQAEQVHARLLPDYFRVSPERDLGPRIAIVAGAPTVTLVAQANRSGGAAQPRREDDQDADRVEGKVKVKDKDRPHTTGTGDSVLGYITVKVVDTPRDPAMTPRRRAHVETVVVDERHRGGGIGTALMRAAADWARRRDASELVLTVWSDNAAAEALYRRLGYHPIARVLRQRLEPE